MSKPHGMHLTRTYQSWKNMKARCLRPSCRQFKDYGGRGINFDPKWEKFVGFYADMGDCPDGMSLDRKDNNKDYCKENCRWATREQQDNNKRDNRHITYEGTTLTVSQWSKKLGVSYPTISARVNRLGWTNPQEILFGKT